MRGRSHSREFKLEIVRQLASGERRPAQVCREHNLAASMVARWRSEEHTSELQSHRDLHSFPTRRSSDLCDHSIVKVNISEKVLYTTAERAKGDTTCEADHTVENLSWKLCVNWQVARDAQPKCVENIISQPAWWHAGDRKSTRLNSSHTEIYTLSLHDALPISVTTPLSKSTSPRKCCILQQSEQKEIQHARQITQSRI